MEILKINNISKNYEDNSILKIKENSKLLFLTITILFATTASIIIIFRIITDRVEVKSSDYPFVINYMSSSYNSVKNQQIEVIESNLNQGGYDYKKTTFEMLNINNEGKYVIKNSQYNKISKELNLKTVKLNKNETLIIPRFDDEKYRKKINKFTEFGVGLYDLKVKGIAEGKVLPKGVGLYVIVVNDKLYSQLETDDGNVKYYVNGYNYNNWQSSASIDENIENEVKEISINNYEKKQEYDSFFSLPKIHTESMQTNDKLIYIENLIIVILYICGLGIVHFKLRMNLRLKKLNQRSLPNVGVYYTEVNKLIHV
ncbi:MAG: hypothetical protein ACRCYC_10800 [Paraclostridium sp.]|uniref:hypothetical protein n=1 Tax=Paraclostridium sp. TaxID=2023273 RepID=UPI003F331178